MRRLQTGQNRSARRARIAGVIPRDGNSGHDVTVTPSSNIDITGPASVRGVWTAGLVLTARTLGDKVAREMLLEVQPVFDGTVPHPVRKLLWWRREVVKRELGPESRGLLLTPAAAAAAGGSAADEVKRDGAGRVRVEVGSRALHGAMFPHQVGAAPARPTVESQVFAVVAGAGITVTLTALYGHADEAQEDHVTFCRCQRHAASHQGRVLCPSIPVRGLQISYEDEMNGLGASLTK